jgi:hypothetical protein
MPSSYSGQGAQKRTLMIQNLGAWQAMRVAMPVGTVLSPTAFDGVLFSKAHYQIDFVEQLMLSFRI